jgi:hypothetical protein
MKRHRSLYLIAADIERDWAKPYFGALPYLGAMQTLDQITEPYFLDSGLDIVCRFLGNAQTWRGPVARAIKAELNTICLECRRGLGAYGPLIDPYGLAS